MLKIKDNVDLKELENLEFKKVKTAREMFEELGYNLHVNDELETMYKYIKDERVVIYIRFDNEEKTFGQFAFLDGSYAGSVDIGFKELQAINKQVEELGWNDAKD